MFQLYAFKIRKTNFMNNHQIKMMRSYKNRKITNRQICITYLFTICKILKHYKTPNFMFEN